MAKTVRLHPHVQEKLQELPRVIRRDWGIPATQESLVAALIHEVTVGQAVGMLMAYTRAIADLPDESDDPAAGEG